MTGIAAELEKALTLHRAGQLDEAIAAYRRVLDRHPRHAPTLHCLGIGLAQGHHYKESVSALAAALEGQPDDPAIRVHYGNALWSLGRPDDALRSYDAAIALDPASVEAHYNRGTVLAGTGHPELALQCFDRALALAPAHVDAHNNRGNALTDLRRHEEALESFERALELRRDFPDALINCSIALRALHRYDESLISCEKALALAPGNAQAHASRGAVLASLARYDEALGSYDRALGIDPALVEARWNKSLLALLRGNFTEGWALYESRLDMRSLHLVRRYPDRPMLKVGDDVDGKVILLYAEQGYGDTIQFCRYASLLRDQGATIVLEVPGSLKALIQSLSGSITVVAQGEALPTFDLHCPLPSLPAALGTELKSIPGHTPYLAPDLDHMHRWATRLEPRRAFRVGLAWSGKPTHRNDANRSIPFADLASLRECGVELISLQKEVRESDAAALTGLCLQHFGADLADFSDTAALISQLDLIISVDTAVTHLAGALGKPVWVLLPLVPDWRWMLNRQDSPWYPTARLFRQTAMGRWDEVIDSVRQELDRLVAAQHAGWHRSAAI